MKILKIVFLGLFLFGLFAAGNANAEIKITLPTVVSGEKLGTIFAEESKNLSGLEVIVKAHEAYKPGSVKRVPDRITIRLRRIETCFFFFNCRKDPYLEIQLKAKDLYREINMIRQGSAENTTWPDWSSTANEDFEKMRPAFEKLLKKVYARLGVE